MTAKPYLPLVAASAVRSDSPFETVLKQSNGCFDEDEKMLGVHIEDLTHVRSMLWLLHR